MERLIFLLLLFVRKAKSSERSLSHKFFKPSSEMTNAQLTLNLSIELMLLSYSRFQSNSFEMIGVLREKCVSGLTNNSTVWPNQACGYWVDSVINDPAG